VLITEELGMSNSYFLQLWFQIYPNHWTTTKGMTEAELNESIAANFKLQDGECAICLRGFREGHITECIPFEIRNCGHVFHRHCIAKWLGREPSCPVCRASAIATLRTADTAKIRAANQRPDSEDTSSGDASKDRGAAAVAGHEHQE
jgi:hypothetical protein